jgi:Ser/Thr protein kinase RdoA (MazF antagonist)
MSVPTSLTPDTTTARFVGSRFGLRAPELVPAPVARGLCGRIWQLRSAGTRYALKELFWEHDQDEQEIRRRVAFEMSARAVGVRCPESLPTVDGDYLCRLPPDLGDLYVRLYSWADGGPLTSTEGTGAWLGGTLGRLHRLRHPAAGEPDPKFESAPTAAQWQEVLSALRAEGTVWAGDLERLLPLIDDLATLITPAGRDTLIMCHLDLTPANVLRTATGLVVVDWDNAGPGAAERELAASLLEWHGSEPDDVVTTMAAYREAGGTARLTGLSSFSAYLGAALKNLHTQASLTIAPDVLDEHRMLANTKTLQAMASLPTRSVLHQIGELAAGTRATTP